MDIKEKLFYLNTLSVEEMHHIILSMEQLIRVSKEDLKKRDVTIELLKAGRPVLTKYVAEVKSKNYTRSQLEILVGKLYEEVNDETM